jgi:hypothetical protein
VYGITRAYKKEDAQKKIKSINGITPNKHMMRLSLWDISHDLIKSRKIFHRTTTKSMRVEKSSIGQQPSPWEQKLSIGQQPSPWERKLPQDNNQVYGNKKKKKISP